MAKFNVTGEQYIQVTRIMRDILRQIDAKNGSSLDPERVIERLQNANEPPIKRTQAYIQVSTESFNQSYFTNGVVRFYIEDNFQRLILDQVPFEIKAGGYLLSRYHLEEQMYYQEIAEYLDSYLFSVYTLLMALKSLTENQPHGEKGSLITNGFANTFHVAMDGNIVRALAFWNENKKVWWLKAMAFEDFDELPAGHAVFSRP